MNTARSEKFRILVVGDTVANIQADGTKIVRLQQSPIRIKERQQFGGAANIVRIAAGMGIMVGFLLLRQADAAMRLHQKSHFHMLLPQFDVIVFSEYGHYTLDDLNDMVASARHLGKRVLLDLDVSRFGTPTGASLIASDTLTLQQIIGAWRSERELTIKMTKLLFDFKCEAYLLNHYESGISLYLPGGVIRFTNMIPCDKYYLQAAIAANLKNGNSLSAAVSEACDRYDPKFVDNGNISCQDLARS